MTNSEDKNITCRDCQQEFVWTKGEQDFYAEKGLSAPSRCRDCRTKRKQMRDQGGQGRPMSNGPKEMFDIVCKKCDKPGQVPFKPTSDDVLCRDCFIASRE
ncbi:zinc-ribbon domain containing protein [Candidatus Berkelbacteria bacterium]|nr:zinc-ribbon domain containing protein [Candidatus Berkelbacteria bacterium]